MIDVGSKESFGFGYDPIVIRKHIAGIQGGKVLDLTGYTEDYIRAGQVVVRDTVNDVYKPMPISGGAYGSLPSNCEYVGVVEATKSAKEPFVAILYNGEVNDKALPYSIDSIKAALKTAVPTLVFKHD